MKIFFKLFISVVVILCISLSTFGYFLIINSFQNTVQREVSQTLEQFELIKFSIKSNVSTLETRNEIVLTNVIKNAINVNIYTNLIGIYSSNKEKITSSFPENLEIIENLEKVQTSCIVYEIKKNGDKYILITSGYLKEDKEPIYLIIGKDITKIITEYEQMKKTYMFIYYFIAQISIIIVLILTLLIITPIKKVNDLAKKIADGDYKSRIKITSNDELGELGKSFNSMTEAIEKSFEQIKQNSVQKEEFVANFAHELKTPLTSIIGYSDMICSKNLKQEQAKEAAQYILNEGMRLESLSKKLMNLIMLNCQKFVFEKLSVTQIFQDITQTIKPMLDKNNIILNSKIEERDILVEYDLFKTLILNIIDNSRKANATKIFITGKRILENYEIIISDNGCGIPENDLNRITEAFFIVDKSRAQKQYSAGIGLALAEKIVKLHKGTLKFESELEKGTKVIITL